MANDKKTVAFMTVSEFKSAIGKSSEKADVVKNPNTGKLFVAIGSANYKCQQAIDPKQEMKFLVEDNNLEEACLTNVKESANNTVFTL